MPAPKVPQKLFDTYLKSLNLDEDELNKIAVDKGWIQREPRNITPASLLFSLCIESLQGDASFNDIGSTIDKLINKKGPSKQAVAKRLNSSFLEILESLLSDLIELKTNLDHKRAELSHLLSKYERIILQDSTIIKLPTWLFDKYSGVSNGLSQVCNARIQAVYDLKNMQFISFEICSYTKTDLVAAPELELRKNDLILRDRGYLSFAEVARHIEAEADCIYRHKSNTTYLDPDTLETIDLVYELRKKGSLDKTVLLNDNKRTAIRLVAQKADKKVAEERRRKAKKESSSKNPSQRLLALCDWTIFLTTIPPEDANFGSIMHVYGLRWRIEVIFKSWKSHLNFSKIHRVSENELKVLLTIRLLLITEGTNVLYRLSYSRIKEFSDKDLSLQKLLKRLSRDPDLFEQINEGLATPSSEHEVWNHLIRYCCYDKRKRPNYFDQCKRND